jgi:hypothetical protein
MSGSEQARSNPEVVGGLADRECGLLLKHAPTIKLQVRIL